MTATQRLQELGLTPEILATVAKAGDAEARMCTDNDPATAAGFTRYQHMVRSLRDQLLSRDWSKDNSRNFARTINPAKNMAIIVVAGDENTGTTQAGVQPSTRYDKGVMVMAAVGGNVQLELPLEFAQATQSLADENRDGSIKTWMLLHYATDAEVRYELSLPVSAKKGYITWWSERIVLSPLTFEPVVVETDETAVADINVAVSRR